MATNELEAVDSRLKSACPETMDMNDLLSSLDLDGVPSKQTVSLVHQNGSLRATIDKNACDSADIGLDTAGRVDTYSYEQHGIVLVDLNSHEPDA